MYQKLFNQQQQQEMRQFFLDLAEEGNLKEISTAAEISLSENNSFAVVYSGQIKQLLLSRKGCQKSLYILRPGEIFGEMDYFNGGPNQILNTAMKNSVISVISKDILEKRLKKRPEIYQYFIHSITRKFRIIMLQMSGLIFNNSAGKLAELLIRLASQESQETDAGVIIDFRLTHQEIADLIGCSRSTVSRELNNFKKEKIITVNNKYITIKDFSALKQYINSVCLEQEGS